MKLRFAALTAGFLGATAALALTAATPLQAQGTNHSTTALPAAKGGVAPAQNARVNRLDPALDKLIAPNARIEKIASGFVFTEGPLWNRGELWFSDLRANKIYSVTPDGKLTVRLDRAGGVDSFDSRFFRGSNGIAHAPDGGLLVAQHSGHRIIKLDGQMRATTFLDKFEGKALSSPNDLVYAQDGALWFTDPPFFFADPTNSKVDPNKAPGKVQATNNVYRFKDGKLTAAITDIALPNGVAFSPDGKILYVADTGARLYRYDVRPDGTVANKRVFADWSSDKGVGLTDGIKVDTQGNVWSSGPGGIRIVNPAGKVLGQIVLPEDAANLAFGGADMKTLYITASTGIYRLPVLATGVKPMYAR